MPERDRILWDTGRDERPPELTTERLRMRGPRAEDFSAYRDFYADEEASGFYGGPLRADQAWRVLAADIGHWHLRGYGRWIIEARTGGDRLGGCGLWWPEGWPRPELTWWIVPGARRRGFALEASGAALSFAFGTPGWPRVETHMKDENAAAARLVDRLGGRLLTRETFPDGVARNVYGFEACP